MVMIVAFIAIQVMAFAMNDPTLIYVSITASVTIIIYMMMQFMTRSNYSGSRAAAVERLKATGTAIRDPNNRFNSAMGRTFSGMKGMANSVLGPDSRLARAAYSMGLGNKQVRAFRSATKNDDRTSHYVDPRIPNPVYPEAGEDI
ncbi:hypothetical protein EXVG_00137 [Emiliania huxleyi virus 202]|nr:hypothetical protein EXVG_00137 [Emiliania huxleyi virus 202]